MVLGWKRPGRVWICQANIKREANVSLSFFIYSKVRLNVIIFLKTEESYKKDYVDIDNI